MKKFPTILPKEITDKYDIIRNTFIGKDKGEVNAEREVELVEKRTETSKTFLTGKKIAGEIQYRFRVSVGAIHYKENYKDGQWKDIDVNHKTDKGDYWLYEKMPIKVKVFKNKVGYEIESRRSGAITRVELDEPTPKEEDVDFDFEIQCDRVRLWKNIKHKDAKKHFQWKIIEENKKTGLHSLKFRDIPDGFDADDDIVVTKTTRTIIDEKSFLWKEECGEVYERDEEDPEKELCHLKKKSQPTYPLRIDTDVSEIVGASSDDAQQDKDGSSWSITNQNNVAGYGTGEGYHGARFLTVNVPQGATINSATYTLTGRYSKSSGTPEWIICGIDEDNTATFSTKADFDGRAETAENSVWANADIGNWDADVEYPKTVTAIIQEIIDRGGWSANNALAIKVKNNGKTGSSDYRYACSYDSSTTKCPQLDITYTANGGAAAAQFMTTNKGYW